jgi:hypothetical protein
MQIYLVFRTYSSYDQFLFKQLVNRLFKLGVKIESGNDLTFREGKEKYAMLEIPESHDQKVKFDKMSLIMMSNLLAGYVYRMRHPMKRHLNIRTFTDYFNELVIDQNRNLLNKLYALENDISSLFIDYFKSKTNIDAEGLDKVIEGTEIFVIFQN